MLYPHKKTYYYSFVTIFLLLLGAACTSEQKHSKKEHNVQTVTVDSTMNHFSAVFENNETMIFRSVNFNMNKEEVKKIEAEKEGSTKLVEDVKNMLFYEIELSTDTSKSIDFAEIKYFFDVNDALDIISINYFILDSTTNSNLSETIFQKMTNRYGESYVDSENYIVWESSFKEEDKSTLFEVATKKLTKLNDPGITVEYLKY